PHPKIQQLPACITLLHVLNGGLCSPLPATVLLCPSPPSIKNGQYNSREEKVFIPGVSVNYHCDPGYTLTGTTKVSCLPSGMWSIPYPRCEVVICTTPAIKNGAVAGEGRAMYNPGDTVAFQCHPGYVLQGSHSAECWHDGRWVPPVPTCVPGEQGCGFLNGQLIMPQFSSVYFLSKQVAVLPLQTCSLLS
uniref:Sushi domain-containing protein n=1 Tax=Nothoprocta perdicaria TaxID=30464 RepID=A0A8C6ZCJ2_NOTPE